MYYNDYRASFGWLKHETVYVAGHKGMVGSAVVRNLETKGYNNVLQATSTELDLRNQKSVRNFFHAHKPQSVILAAATVGGILANNTFRGDFLYNNLQIETNVIQAAKETGVNKLIFLGSSCIYPKEAPQPIKEESLLTGPLEPTNEPYAVAKIAGIKLCESFYAQHGCNFYPLMPCNLYGINDNFNLKTSHVLPALLRKFHEAKEKGSAVVEIWGSGTPRREFLFVDDLASAIASCLEKNKRLRHLRPRNFSTKYRIWQRYYHQRVSPKHKRDNGASKETFHSIRASLTALCVS